METQPALPSFDYNANPQNRAWTQVFVKSAYSREHSAVVQRLFKEATQLVQDHRLTRSEFKGQQYPKLLLDKQRERVATELQQSFGDLIAIDGHSSFAYRLCKGVLTYQGGPGMTADTKRGIRGETQLPTTPHSTPQKTPLPPPSWDPFQSSSSPATPHPPIPMELEDFEINCRPSHISAQSLPCKLRIGRIADRRTNETLNVEHLRYDRPWSLLLERQLVLDSFQFLIWNTERGDESYGLSDDDDLHDAVYHLRKRSLNSMTVKVMSAEDLGAVNCPSLKDKT